MQNGNTGPGEKSQTPGVFSCRKPDPAPVFVQHSGLMTVYVVENGYFVHRAKVLSAEGEICAVKKESGESRILAAGEFYLRREDAARAARQNEMQARDRDGRLRKVC